MSELHYSLCPKCDACPEVVISAESVVIGEPGNEVQLSPSEWNTLVEGVREGRLAPLATSTPSADGCGCGCDCDCC